MALPLSGIIPVHKPVGPTSHDMVYAARRALQTKHIGHAGTLDPFAEGIVLILVGETARLQSYFMGKRKTYTGTILFGTETDSCDCTGNVLSRQELPANFFQIEENRKRLLESIPSFIGKISQTPPAHSALKIDGVRAYELARKGIAVEMKPREIEVYDFKILKFEQLEVSFEITVSAGTYIRSVARDLGKALELPSLLQTLVRVASGEIQLKDCVKPEEISRERLISPLRMLPQLKTVLPSLAQMHLFKKGDFRTVDRSLFDSNQIGYLWNGELFLILEKTGDKIKPIYNLSPTILL